MNIDLQQTFQDEFFYFFLHMSRCALISPLCTEQQNVGPKEWLVSDNQSQITSPAFSLEERADPDERTQMPPPSKKKDMCYSPPAVSELIQQNSQ